MQILRTYILPILFVIAGISFTACTVCRGLLYGGPGITDHKHFAQETIHKSDCPFHFAKGDNSIWKKLKFKVSHKGKLIAHAPLDTLLSYTPTAAFVIIRNDSILFEQYAHGYDRDKVSTIFSVSKTLTCLLAEIAIDEVIISSIDDPVVKYVPELSECDPMWNQVTVRHLMDMRAGIKFDENYASRSPFGKMARMYYGCNSLGQIKKMKFESQPGTASNYQSISTNVLGFVIERATDKPLAKYTEEKVWQPLGMEYDASLSLDSKKHRFPKAFGGFSATAIDLAKIGRLYLNNGNWNGRKIIDSTWINRSSSPYIENYGYQLSWRTIRNTVLDTTKNAFFTDSLAVVARIRELGGNPSEHTIVKSNKGRGSKKNTWIGFNYNSGAYYALGILDQVIYINPAKRIIMIRTGKKDKIYDYPYLMHRLTDYL